MADAVPFDDSDELLTRDVVTLAAVRVVLGLIAGALIALGLLEGGGGALWPDVIDAFSVSNGLFGLASGIGLTLAFPVLVFGGRLTSRFDTRLLLATASLILAGTLCGLAVGYGAAALIALLACRGIGIVLLDLSSNAMAMEVEQRTRRHLMSPLHAGFSAGTVIGAGMAWVAFAMGAGFRAVFAILAILFATFAAGAIWRSLRVPERASRVEVAGASALAFGLFRRSDIRSLALLTGVAFSGEMLIAQWIGIYLRDEQGFSPGTGAAAVILLGGAMFIGRLINGPVTERAGPVMALTVQGVLILMGAAMIVIPEGAAIAVAGCGVAGLGLAGVAPTALSLAGNALPEAAGAATGATLIGGYAGVALVPFAAGLIASVASVRVVLGAEAIGGLVVLWTAYRISREMAGGSGRAHSVEIATGSGTR